MKIKNLSLVIPGFIDHQIKENVMSTKKIRWLILASFLAIFVSGCQCSDNQIAIMDMINDTPALYEIINSLLPTFTFHNSEDCQKFMWQLEEALRLDGVVLYAYVLMRNHYLCGAPHKTWYVK